MTTTLAEAREQVRLRLEDTGENTVWSDDEIDAGLRQSLDRFALQFPAQGRADVVVSQGETAIELPADAIQVKRVADPRGVVIPPRGTPLRDTAQEEQSWEQWAGEIEFTQPLVSGDYRIWYTASIVFPTADADPLPATEHDAMLLMLGAAAWCLEQRAVADWKRGPLPARYETVLRRMRAEYDAAWRARLRLMRTGRLTATG